MKTQNYIVTLYENENIDDFIKKITKDGFEVIGKLEYGIIFIKGNGKLEELKSYPEVEHAEIDRTVSI
jgi:hypothetical protein